MITEFLSNFIMSYIEYIFIYIFTCSFTKTSLSKNKIAFLYGLFVVALTTTLHLFGILSEPIRLLFSYFLDIIVLTYTFKKPFLHMIVIYIFDIILIIIAEIIQLPLWAVFTSKLSEGMIAYVGNAIVLIISLLCYRFVPLHRIYDMVTVKAITFWMIISNSFLICFGTILFARINKNDIFSHYILILVVLLLLLFINGEVYLNYRKKLEQQKILATYEENLSIVDSLIEKISVRQHDYHNDLQAIQSLGFLHKDYESLKNALLETTGHYILNRTQETLLKLNLHLFAGFLVSKVRQAESQSKKLDITIDNFNLVTTITEYELIEHVGILIDNAMEATPQGESIYAVVSSSQGTISFKIKNPGPKISSELLKSIFKKGHTTKKKDSRPHGIGLYKLNKYVKEHNGRLIVKNEFINDTTYLCFELII